MCNSRTITGSIIPELRGAAFFLHTVLVTAVIIRLSLQPVHIVGLNITALPFPDS